MLYDQWVRYVDMLSRDRIAGRYRARGHNLLLGLSQKKSGSRITCKCGVFDSHSCFSRVQYADSFRHLRYISRFSPNILSCVLLNSTRAMKLLLISSSSDLILSITSRYSFLIFLVIYPFFWPRKHNLRSSYFSAAPPLRSHSHGPCRSSYQAQPLGFCSPEDDTYRLRHQVMANP